jgi:signal transduction histidine kinase
MEHGRDGSSNSPDANGSARPSWNSSAVRPNKRRAVQQRNEERLRLARDLHDALGHQVALVSLQSAVAAEALPERVPEAQHAIA